MKSMKKVIKPILIILILVLLIAVAYSTSSNKASSNTSDFTLMTTNGDEIALSDLRGKVVVLNFFATWCPPCKAELPGFLKTVEAYKNNKDLVFLFIDVSEKKEEVLTFLQENNYNTMVPLLDLAGEVSNQYKVGGIPSTFILDKQGNILQSHEGYMEETQLKSLIEDALK